MTHQTDHARHGSTERCTNEGCGHTKRDHSGRRDHREKYGPVVAGDPWCHACGAECLYEPPAAVSAAVAPPTDTTHGLSVQHADALWDAVAIPGPHTPTYPEQHERVCRAVRDILDELTPARDEEADQTALREQLAAAVRSITTVGGTPPQLLVPVIDGSNPRMARIVDWQPLEAFLDSLLAVLPEAADWDALAREADRLRRDGKTLHARAEELDSQLAALRQQVTEPADRAAVLREAADQLDRYVGLQSSDAAPEVEGARLVIRELRRMADETATETPAPDDRRLHACIEFGTWFDRSVCAEPCGAMHTRCTECGVALDACPQQPAAGARQDGDAS